MKKMKRNRLKRMIRCFYFIEFIFPDLENQIKADESQSRAQSYKIHCLTSYN